MNTTTWKTTLWRSARTFVQAALAYAAVNLAGLINSGESITKTALGALAVSAISAGIAALMNLPQKGAGFDLTDGTAEVVPKTVNSINQLPMAGQSEPDEDTSDSKEASDNG